VSALRVPERIIKEILVENSFKNVKEDEKIVGFEFKIRNTLGSGTIDSVYVFKVDEEMYSPDQIIIIKGKEERKGSTITASNPLYVDYGDVITLRFLREGGLKPGKHKVEGSLGIMGIGTVTITFELEMKE